MSDTGSRGSQGGSVRADESRSGESRPPEESGGGGAGGTSELVTGKGATTIADGVVMKIANMAAREIPAVADLGGGVSGAIGNVVGRLRGSEHQTAGISAEVGERQAAIDLTLRIYYPASIGEVADAVRQNVIQRVEATTGLQVVEVNINVSDLTFPGEDDDSDQQQQGQPSGRVQ